MLGEVTVIIWGRQLATATTNEVWLRHGGPADSAATGDNVTFGVRMSVNGKVEVFWEQGAGSGVAYEFDFIPTNWETYMLAIRRRDVGGGNVEVDLFVNQQLVETSGALTAPSGATNTTVRWSLLGSFLAALTAASCAEADIQSVSVYGEALPIEDIRTEHRRGTLMEFYPRVDLRVEVEDANGDWRDLTDLDGVDWVDGVSFQDQSSDGPRAATIELLREQRLLSNALLRTDTKLNLTDVDDVTSYDPLLQLTRGFRIYMAWLPLGVDAEGRDWMLVFEGNIDKVNNGGEKTTIRGRDLVGKLVDTHIEEEVLNPALGNADEPEKQFSYGLASGEPQESVIQGILNDNDNDTANDTVAGLEPRVGSYDPITLVTTAPSTTVLKPYRQTRVPVYTAIRERALANGGDVKVVWNEELESFALTLFVPGRDRVDSDTLLEARDVLSVSTSELDVKDIRTVVRTTYLSSETTTPTPPALPAGYSDRQGWAGTDGDDARLPAFYEIRNDTAIGEYGRRFMELGERQTVQLDTIIEVATLTKAGVDDLSEPDLVFSAEIPLMPMLKVGDILQLRNETLFTSVQRLAVTSVDHSFGSQAVTRIGLRGKPTLGLKRWLDIEQVPGVDRPSIVDPRLALFDVDGGPQLRVLRQLGDNTRYNTDAKALLISNRDFANWSAGSQNPPDTWAVDNGTWVTDMGRSSTSFSGTRSVEFTNATGIIKSKTFAMQGGTQTPYSFEMVWERAAVGSNVPVLTVEWLDANDNTVDTVDLQPGGVVPFDFPAVPTTANVWFRSRTDGVVPTVGGSVRGRVYLKQSAAGTIRINSIEGYRSAYSSKMRFAAATNVSSSATNLYNVPLTGTITPPDEWDSTVQFTDDTASPNPNEGWYWDTVEAGRYDVRASMTSSNVPNPSTTARIQHVLVKNGTFNSGIESGAGTIVWEGDAVDVNYNASGFADTFIGINATVSLDAGDRLSVCTRVLSATGLVALYGGVTNYSAFEITQRLTQ
jgi:hypothetical protein